MFVKFEELETILITSLFWLKRPLSNDKFNQQ